MLNRFNLNEFLSDFAFANSVSAGLLTASLSSNVVSPLVDYDVFDNHVFFGNATRKTTVNINFVISTYPIGLSGSATSSLSSDSVAQWENWNLQATGFQKFMVDYLCGATADNISPSLTSSATGLNGEIVTLNVISRDVNNNVKDSLIAYDSSLLLSAATLYDEGQSKFKITSGTGSEYFVIPTQYAGQTQTTKYIPAELPVPTNRNMELINPFPDIYTDDDSQENFQNFLAVIGDFFDAIKEYIDEFPNLWNVEYSGFDRAPEGLAEYLIAKEIGLNLFEGALVGDLPTYYQKIGVKGLQKLTHAIWNRILSDMPDLLKAKGTREGFNRLVRNFGIYDGFISAREYVDNLETINNTYEKNLTVKLPFFNQFDIQDIQITPTVAGSTALTSNATGFTVLGQTILPFLDSASGSITPIMSVKFGGIHPSYINFYYDGRSSTPPEFGLSQSKTFPVGSTTKIISVSSSLTADFVDSYKHQLTPFAFTFNTSASSFTLDLSITSITASATAFYNTYSLKNLSILLNDATMIFGAPSTGSYANIKLFDRPLASTSSYFLNPHARYEEQNMMFDYKLYDSPSASITGTGITLSAINSFTNPIIDSYWQVQADVLNYNYELYPINFKRIWESNGLLLPGGDFVITDTADSVRRGSNNFGYGLFSSEAINNDILDYYSSTSALNISNFYSDPNSYYFEGKDKRSWDDLVAYRNKVINKSRYPNGINYSAFIRLVNAYRFVLANFFNTADQFIRFKSRIIQKGVNIEPTLLDRNKQRIVSTENTVSASNISYKYPKPKTRSASANYVHLTPIKKFKSFESKKTDSSLSGFKTFKSNTQKVGKTSLTGIKSIKTNTISAFIQTITGSVFDLIIGAGVQNTERKIDIFGKIVDSKKINPISRGISSSADVESIVTINKNVIETSKDITIPLTSSFDVVYYNNPGFIGSGTSTLLSPISNSYISGIDLNCNFTTTLNTTTADLTALKYFVTVSLGSIPITGTLSGGSFTGNTSVTGLALGRILQWSFKDLGDKLDQNYYRKYAKLNLKAKLFDSYIFDKNDVFYIKSPVDKDTNLPIYNFYCFNNNQYYNLDSFNLPAFKDGTDVLISVNPAFNNTLKGNQHLQIINLYNNKIDTIDLHVVPDATQFTDSTFQQLGSAGTGGKKTTFTESFTLSLTDLSNGYLIFAKPSGKSVDSTSLLVTLNGIIQNQFIFYTYDGSNPPSNKLVFTNTGSLQAGDVIDISYNF